MAEETLNQKIKILERDISKIKKYLGFLDFFTEDRDFENWQKVRRFSRKIRKELFKETYPKLYEKLAKDR